MYMISNTMFFTVVAQINGNSIPRRTVNFPPSICQDRFLQYDSKDMMRRTREGKLKVKELKEVVKREVFTAIRDDNSSRQLKLIDSVQRLGLSHHFEKEMEDVLLQMFDKYQDQVHKDKDLHDVSLRFRLLRQRGFNVSAGIFEKFKEKNKGNNNFDNFIANDIPGLLALFEASHLRIHGEDILDEALVFTTNRLEATENKTDDPILSAKISSALKRPIRKTLERLYARNYISLYQEEPSHHKSLLELAKVDFNHLQNLHKMELCDILRWWKELDLGNKLPFTLRDRIVEIYVSALGVHFEPQYLLARKCLTKNIALGTLLDDTYDSYGTFQELQRMNEAIQRWAIKLTDQLPEYMQHIHGTLLKTYQEIEEEIPKGKSHGVHYAKEAMKVFVRAYLEEARWLHQEYIPSLDEYLSVSLITVGISNFTTISLVPMGDIVTKNIFEWFLSDPKILVAANTIGRLLNDIAGHKIEQKRQHIASSVECYRKQYGVTEQEAYTELNKKVVSAWKDLNQEILFKSNNNNNNNNNNAIPMHVLRCVLNLARDMEFLYGTGVDGYTQVGKEMINAVVKLLVDPVPL